MNRVLMEKFNRINFKGLENVLCGDAMYYLEVEESGIKTIVQSWIRIFISILCDKCEMQLNGDGKIIFLFSNTYGRRKDLRRWFDEICELSDSKLVVAPRKYVLSFGSVKKFGCFISWSKEVKKMGISSRERMYYLSRLLSAASDIWSIQKWIQKRQLEPKLFVSTCDVHIVDCLATQVFNQKGITTASLQHGVISRKMNPWSITGSKSKYYLIYGEFTKQQGLKAGVRFEKMISLGMPQYTKHIFENKMKNNVTNEFGIILGGGALLDTDCKMLQLADKFAKNNKLKYKIKLHPGSKKEEYSGYIESSNISAVYSDEVNVYEFSELVDFCLIGQSVVFIEYTLHLMPAFIYRDLDETDIWEGIDWCKIKDLKEMQCLYNRLIEDRVGFETNILQTRKFLCEFENVAQNYRTFFERYN